MDMPHLTVTPEDKMILKGANKLIKHLFTLVIGVACFITMVNGCNYRHGTNTIPGTIEFVGGMIGMLILLRR